MKKFVMKKKKDISVSLLILQEDKCTHVPDGNRRLFLDIASFLYA